MPTYIPYEHSSLSLGSVVDEDVLKLIVAIGKLEKDSDAAFDHMNSLMGMQRSLKMTLDELVGLEIKAPEMGGRLSELQTAIQAAAQNYITKRLANDKQIQTLRENLAATEADDTLDSPVNFETCNVVRKQVGFDSMRLDMQYFSYGESDEENQNTVIQIANAIRTMTAELNQQTSSEMARTASQQVSQQLKTHDLNGTLVITATCTHKDASMLVPLDLDADRMLEIWNHLHGDTDEIDPSDLTAMRKLAHSVSGSKDGLAGSIPLLVGFNLGSAFVGMVHTVNHDEFESNRTAEDVVGMEDKVRLANWLSAMEGKLGMDRDVGEEIRDILGKRKIYAHVNMITAGAVPTFSSNLQGDAMKDALKGQVGRAQEIAKRATPAAGQSKVETEQTASDATRRATLMANMDSNMTKELLSSLDDRSKDPRLDVTSMITAFNNYVAAITSADPNKPIGGVPIGYHVRRIGADLVARLWLEKYFPEFSAKTAKPAAAASGQAAKPVGRK